MPRRVALIVSHIQAAALLAVWRQQELDGIARPTCSITALLSKRTTGCSHFQLSAEVESTAETSMTAKLTEVLPSMANCSKTHLNCRMSAQASLRIASAKGLAQRMLHNAHHCLC